jgi:hypothetical protein
VSEISNKFQNQKKIEFEFDSEYFSQSTTSGAWKIQILAQIFYTAS